MNYKTIHYGKIKFDSFVELVKVVKDETSKYCHAITVRYDGNQLRGDVTIELEPGHSDCEDFAEVAAKILKF